MPSQAQANQRVYMDWPTLITYLIRGIRAPFWLVAYDWRTGHKTRLGIPQRIACLAKGHVSYPVAMWGLERAPDSRLYVSEWRERVLGDRPNRPYHLILKDKLLFWLTMRALTPRVTPLWGFVQRGRYWSVEKPSGIGQPLTAGFGALPSCWVMKPTRGHEGQGFAVVERSMSGFKLNGKPTTMQGVVGHIGRSDYVIAPRIEQADYARCIFPHSLNTIRVMTMIDVDTGEVRIPFAIHRFGVHATAPIDAFFAGGIVAPIELETGELGAVVTQLVDGKRRILDVHPETGARVRGVRVPHWQEVREELLALAERLPFLPWIAWDVVITEGGFLINEGNEQPSLKLLQTFGPLLANPSVAKFLRYHGVVP